MVTSNDNGNDFDERFAALVSEMPGLEYEREGEIVAERSHDYWARSAIERRLGISAPVASALVRPVDAAQVAAVLGWASRTGTPVVPFGLGSGVCGGVLAGEGQVVLDLGHMNRIVALDEESLTVTVEPGMRGSDFEEELRKRGYTMGHWPQSIEVSTVGGWCATRAAGQFSTWYGNIEDMLLGCEVALADGRLIRIPPVPRAATGPDLRALFLGSEGTLGVFTELTYRIHPAPEKQVCRAYAMPTIDAGFEALRLIMRAGWRPAVTRLYDDIETERNFNIPDTEGRSILFLLSEGAAERIEPEAAAMDTIVRAQGGEDRGTEPVETWLDHRNKVPSWDDLLSGDVVADTIEVAISWDRIGDLYRQVTAAGRAVEGMAAHSGHLSHSYTQGANIYFTFVGLREKLEGAVEFYDAAWDATLAATHALGGTVAHHHGIGRVRKPWLPKELGEAVDVLRALKRTLDPAGVLNPGVLVDPS